MKDAIEATNNNTSITGVLESILITSDSSPMSQMFSYVFDIINSVYDIAIASGIQIIIFLSALQTISPSMFEAAKIEGCTAWESFWKITLPMVSSMILVNIVYTVIDFFLKTQLWIASTQSVSEDEWTTVKRRRWRGYISCA